MYICACIFKFIHKKASYKNICFKLDRVLGSNNSGRRLEEPDRQSWLNKERCEGVSTLACAGEEFWTWTGIVTEMRNLSRCICHGARTPCAASPSLYVGAVSPGSESPPHDPAQRKKHHTTSGLSGQIKNFTIIPTVTIVLYYIPTLI